MRRFLDWTAAQTGGQMQSASSSDRRNSYQDQGESLPGHQNPHSSSTSPTTLNPTRDLELQHLTKLLHEIKYFQASSSPLPSTVGSQNQREFIDKIHRTIPLFLKVFAPDKSSSDLFAEIGVSDHRHNLRQDASCGSPSTKPNSPLPAPKSPQMERFPDLLPFAFTIARLFVSEVRQRASNKHAEEASLAILNYLNINATSTPLDGADHQATRQSHVEQSTQGWSLLLSLNTLALSQSTPILQLLCDASLPSTLIKCLYLFFDLPAESPSCSDKDNDDPSQHSRTHHIEPSFCRDITTGPLIKAFTQLLVQLCSYQAAIDELIKKDDLRLLIGIASSQCLAHNRPWRQTAFQALVTISKNMRDNFIYLEHNSCIQVFAENMHRVYSLGLATIDEFIDMIKVLVEFLYNLDVNNRNQPSAVAPLIQQFKASRINDLIEESIIKIDETIQQDSRPASPTNTDSQSDPLGCPVSQQPSVSSEFGVCIDEYRRYGKKLIQTLTTMAKVNLGQESMASISTLKPLAMSRFEMLEQFRMPKPSAKNCILNNDALRLMKMAWSRCRDLHMTEAILDATISLFNDDKYNYFIFESQQLLVYYMTSSNFNRFSYKLKQKLFKFLEFIIIETNYIPCVELGTLGTIIRKKSSSNSDKIFGLRTLIASLRFNSKFSDIFREIGLLEVIVEMLIETMQQDNLNQHNTDKLEVLYLLLEASQYLLAGPNNANCTQFNESGAARHVFNCLSKPKFFHLFVPAHSSSSDDGGQTANSRTSTPTPTALSKFRHLHSSVGHQQWPDTWRAQSNKPSIKQMQKVAFTIMRQLILSTAGDEHLANLLGLLARNLEDLKSLARADKIIGAESESNDENSSGQQQAAEMDMTFLLSQEVNLKICILKSLMIILKDSHRCRKLFKKVGGFVYIVSSLVVLEKALPSSVTTNDVSNVEPHNTWLRVNSRRIWRLIKSSLMTIVVAMRSEPANSRAFSDEAVDNFTGALRRLGSFKVDQTSLEASSSERLSSQQLEAFESYKSIFLASPSRDFSTIANDTMKPNEACCQLFRFLYDMSLDMADGVSDLDIPLERPLSAACKLPHGPQQQQMAHDTKSISFDQDTSSTNPAYGSSVFHRRSHLHRTSLHMPSLDLKGATSGGASILKFPCIVISMLDLIPSCPSEDLMIFICLIIKSLLKHERNQQLLCDAGMINRLLSINWRVTMMDKNHFLHQFVEFMFEKLTKQSITSVELKKFLRLGDPLKCSNLDEIEITESFDETRQKLTQSLNNDKNNSSVSLDNSNREKISTDRIETLVAMMSDHSKPQPPFIEFDMSSDGCSSIFMPSIAPVNAKSLPPNLNSFLNSTLDVHTNEKNGILGGVGSSERQFPPLTGLSFSTWICVENFPARSSDPNHNLRLLTIYRGSAATGKEYSCFRIQISALDRALTISTQESQLFDNESRNDAQLDPDCHLRVWTPELLMEGRWHHIVVTMNRSSVKQSNIHVFVDGVLVHQQRICYISSFVGSTNGGPLGSAAPNRSAGSAAAFVNAFIGSLPQFRIQLKTRWKQGPCHLIEEPLNANFVSLINALGPDFIGNFQSSNKLSDIVKLKSNAQVKSNEVSRRQKHELPGQQRQHKPLVHQQSAAVVSSSARSHTQLARVSSSNTGSSGQQVQHQQSSSGSYVNFNLAEDRIIMNIDARSTSLMTLSRMRRIYTRFDCRQVNRVLGLTVHENSTPILLLHNTGVHLNGPSRGVGAITIGYNQVRCFVPSPTEQTLFNVGGCVVLLGFIAQSQTDRSFLASFKALVLALKGNIRLQAQMDNMNGYQILAVMMWKKKHLLSYETLELIISLILDQANSPNIQQVSALRELICEAFDLWLQVDMINPILEFIYNLINSSNQEMASNSSSASGNKSRARNLKCLREMDLLPRMFRLLLRHDLQQSNGTHQAENSIKAFDTQAVYLIKQTVFELLNRTPRQSDILYFGQFLASLLPSENQERASQTVGLRNILLKSLSQMMTNNKQAEINCAMQEELVRILGFDWFMLFISGSHIDHETITIGFLNLMIVLSNDDLYSSFKSKSTPNGGWLKEPTFPSMDGKFNIQVLGINVGVFFGLSGKRKAMKQDIIDGSNFFLLINCLGNLVKMPRIYLMIFLTMTNGLDKLDSNVLDAIQSFDKMNSDILCDCLIGDTHHKRRQTLANIQFKCQELIVCLVYMLRDIMWQHRAQEDTDGNVVFPTREREQFEDYPMDVIRFFMYLYNNNHEFQSYCRCSDDLIVALAETLMQPPDQSLARRMTLHPASKEVLELSRLIILDKMTEPSSNPDTVGTAEQLYAFERYLEALASCKEAQGELVDMLLRQVLLMIDSTARHNSIKTIGTSENILQFQLLLVNSIVISQIVTDKIWQLELYQDHLGRILAIIDHQLCLAEQIYKFNELLPKHNPPHAFMMQRSLNRIILFALSRPMQHMSDKIMVLDLLKRIHDNRTIIVLNHMHSPQSAEFFVCFTYCLMKIIEDNTMLTSTRGSQFGSQTNPSKQPTSLIERQYGHPSSSLGSHEPSSTALLLASMARKVWDAIFQSKKGILSEAFDVSLSLPAFTLDTSLDLLQLKPDIIDTCERYWAGLLESEQKPKRRLQQRPSEPASGATASNAVNSILSGRLTRVVNAASFVSRVVGATAGSMASNVNLVGEKFSQNRNTKVGMRSTPDVGVNNNLGSPLHQAGPNQANQSGSFSGNSIESLELFKLPSITREQFDEAFKTHISIIEDYIKSQLSQKNHKLALHKYLCDEWLDIEDDILLREKALFGPDYGSELEKWILDLTEGPRRMRKKMVNHTRQFYDNYPYRAEQYNPSNKSLRYRPPMSYDSHLYYLKTVDLDSHLLELADKTSNEPSKRSLDEPESTKQEASKQTEPQPSPDINIDRASPEEGDKRPPARGLNSPIESLTAPTIHRGPSVSPSDGDMDDGDTTSFVDFSPEIEAEANSAGDSDNHDSLSVLRLLEKNERISHMFRCSRVQGLDTYEGLLLFGREHFYLIDGFTLLKTREIKDIDSLPPDAHDPIIPNSTPNILAHSKKTCSKFSFDSVVEVHKRRYLLQPIALEVFSSDGRNTLIVFPRNIRNKVYGRLMTVATQITNNAHESLAGQKSNVSVEGGSGLLSNLIGETSVTQRWVRGELSNFQYLMNLNTIAGRSYNDLMQYPIFPWVLADYSSDYLDLSKASTFRDLSRPVGAQTSDRLEQFKRRYAEWDDTETPPYHYGTFYSSAMIVASYMVRMEPFTQHFLRLQGGHFDLADRMFHSIHDSWLSASKHNMADIKELIPEFFYLPEFLKNENKYDLGIKQNGRKLDDVVLPPWAKNDTREFIRLHRCALESDYVSAHLHEWIDLIFGHKQQGQAAVDAVNVFHHLFYEGNVDIYNTDIDPIKKNAVIGFINNFGQVPKQLFKRPHPVRRVMSSVHHSSGPTSMPLTPILPSLSAASNAYAVQRSSLTHCPQSLRQLNSTVKDLRGPVGQIVQIDKNVVAVEQNKLLIPPEYCRYIAWGHADRSLRLGLYDSEKPIFVWEGSDFMAPSEILCCTIPNSRTMITAATESLITVWKIDRMRSFTPVLNLYGHVEPVTCLASSQAYSLIVSGSRDRTAIIWDLNRFTFVRQLGGGPKDKLVHRGPISAIAINDSTGDIATCALSWLYLWTINGELLAQVDSFNITIQQSIGGQGVSMMSNPSQLHLLSACFSQYSEWDLDEVIVTGSSDGSVAIWSLRYYQAPMTEAEVEAAEKKRASELGSESINELPKMPDGEQTTEAVESASKSNETVASSEPIDIKTRKRTDTMNSEWVRLSTSSTSTADTIPVLRATPSSLNDHVNDSLDADFVTSGESFTCEAIMNSPKNDQGEPRCSTPISLNEVAIGSGSTLAAAKDGGSAGNLCPGSTGDELDDQSIGSKANLLLTPSDPTLIKFSKSDTSLVDSFVILGDASGANVNNQQATGGPTKVLAGDRIRPQSSAGTPTPPNDQQANARRALALGGLNRASGRRQISRTSAKLQPNHKWKRELYLRMLLPRRGGKAIPSPVTSLAISKDHKNLYVGDAGGRISCWSTS